MRLLLYSKDCVRFQLMNGCECILEQIVFDDDEPDHGEVLAGDPISLEYMPVALVLRVQGVAWRLRAQELPETLPEHLEVQRGVFVLRPHAEYLRRHVERDL